jgi:cytochrome c oxidase subunit 2
MQGSASWLEPGGGGAARRIADLWWVMLAAAAAVIVLVLAALGYALTHRGDRAPPRTSGDDRAATLWILGGGVALPVVMLTPLLLLTLYTLGELAPPAGPGDLEVEVVGRQWWWDVRYVGAAPAAEIRSANEIHLPVGERVRVRLRSADVIHSFWVPGLQGKMDLVPGRENLTWLHADTPGVYRGECAEFCGLQHARMAFTVVAHSREDFTRWLAAERRPGALPADSLATAGQQVFLRSACSFCHAVRGTPARGQVAPDLTHLAGRRTLAAGTLPNTKGHLAGWVGNPQAIKPGSKMPRVPLAPEELQALLHYLRSLE